jgi:hypothetical protein
MKTLKTFALFAILATAALFVSSDSASACHRYGGYYGGYRTYSYPVVYRTVTPIVVVPRPALGYWAFDAFGNKVWVPYSPAHLVTAGY